MALADLRGVPKERTTALTQEQLDHFHTKGYVVVT